jgi:hypothetical protein
MKKPLVLIIIAGVVLILGFFAWYQFSAVDSSLEGSSNASTTPEVSVETKNDTSASDKGERITATPVKGPESDGRMYQDVVVEVSPIIHKKLAFTVAAYTYMGDAEDTYTNVLTGSVAFVPHSSMLGEVQYVIEGASSSYSLLWIRPLTANASVAAEAYALIRERWGVSEADEFKKLCTLTLNTAIGIPDFYNAVEREGAEEYLLEKYGDTPQAAQYCIGTYLIKDGLLLMDPTVPIDATEPKIEIRSLEVR